MNEAKSRICCLPFHVFFLIAIFLLPVGVKAKQNVLTPESVHLPQPLKTKLSENKKILYNAQPVKVFIADPNPPESTRYIPPPAWISSMPNKASTAAFQISYVAHGEKDAYGLECHSFPSKAKAALNTAANIWAKLLHTRTPITIRACWGNFGENSQTLGYSGGGAYHRDFSGATRVNTWYVSSLANALYGSDIDSTGYDMHITFNSKMAGVYHWNYNLDGNVASDEYDLVSVALHEICHGLGFSGSINSSGSEDYPVIYDVFTRDTFGTSLLDIDESYPYTLSETLTIGRVYFHGSHAMAANGGKRVELFTPDIWMPGSSYSHLSMNFNHTSDSLMVYMLSRAEAIHNPGPIVLGLLRDLGWPKSAVGPPRPPSQPPEEDDENYLPYLHLLLGN